MPNRAPCALPRLLSKFRLDIWSRSSNHRAVLAGACFYRIFASFLTKNGGFFWFFYVFLVFWFCVFFSLWVFCSTGFAAFTGYIWIHFKIFIQAAPNCKAAKSQCCQHRKTHCHLPEYRIQIWLSLFSRLDTFGYLFWKFRVILDAIFTFFLLFILLL